MIRLIDPRLYVGVTGESIIFSFTELSYVFKFYDMFTSQLFWSTISVCICWISVSIYVSGMLEATKVAPLDFICFDSLALSLCSASVTLAWVQAHKHPRHIAAWTSSQLSPGLSPGSHIVNPLIFYAASKHHAASLQSWPVGMELLPGFSHICRARF